MANFLMSERASRFLHKKTTLQHCFSKVVHNRERVGGEPGMEISETRVELSHLSWSPFHTNPEWTRFTRTATLGLEQSHTLELRDLHRAYSSGEDLMVTAHIEVSAGKWSKRSGGSSVNLLWSRYLQYNRRRSPFVSV